jgi:hypothetical protein
MVVVIVVRGVVSGGGKGGGEVGGKDNGKGIGGGGGQDGGIGPSLYLVPCSLPWSSPPRGWWGAPPCRIVADVIVVVDAKGSRDRQIAAIRRRHSSASRRRRHQRQRCPCMQSEVFLLRDLCRTDECCRQE